MKQISILIIGFLIILSALVVIGESADDETVTVTLDYPTASSTVESYTGHVQINCSATLADPADSKALLHNVTLYINTTDNPNHTVGFQASGWNNNVTFVENGSWTEVFYNGTSNSTSFNWTTFGMEEGAVNVTNESIYIVDGTGTIAYNQSAGFNTVVLNASADPVIHYIGELNNGSNHWNTDLLTEYYDDFNLTSQGNLSVNSTFGNGTYNISYQYMNVSYKYVTYNCYVCTTNNNCSWGASNYSFMVDLDYDTTAPSLSVTFPSQNSTFDDSKPYVNVTVTDDTYIENITLYLNWTDVDYYGYDYNGTKDDNYTMVKNHTYSNTKAETPFDKNMDNTTIMVNITNWTSGTDSATNWYNVFVWSCDYNNNCEASNNITFYLDQTVPAITTLANTTMNGSCDAYNISFVTTESVNYSLIWSTNKDNFSHLNYSNGSASTTSHVIGSRYINMTNLTSGLNYYYNLTVCDLAGNCNESASHLSGTDYGRNFIKNWGACTGWSAYGILQTNTVIGAACDNVTRATTCSKWNETSQSFLNYISNTTTNENVTLVRGESMFMYTDGNDQVPTATFMDALGNTTVNGTTVAVNFYNHTGGNWTTFGLLNCWTMGNISEASGVLGNWTVISKYDNPGQRYVDHIYGFQLTNTTEMYIGEMVWAWQNKYEAMWNRTSVYANLSAGM